MPPIPEDLRSKKLKPILLECVEATKILHQNRYQLGMFPDDIFANAMGQWFLPDGLSDDQLEAIADRKAMLKTNGFDGDHLKRLLNELFESDEHLASCCKTVWMLTKYLSSLFLNYTGADLTNEEFETSFSAFSNYLYSEEYQVFAVHHLYNFNSDIDRFEINDTVFKRFSRKDVAFVLENEAVFNLFYAENCGEFFAYREVHGDESNPENFINQLRRTNAAVNDVVGILQFVRDGLVYSDYSFLTYKPTWVNKLFPPHPVGEPRRSPYDTGSSFYKLGADDINRIQTWLGIWGSAEIQARLEEATNLGRLVRLAIELYTSSFYQLDEAQRLLHLTFALEALFSPSENQELSFRIRQYASQFVGENVEERQLIYEIVKRAYGYRSKLVHGSLDVSAYIDDTLTTADDNLELASVVRRAILRMLALLFNGRKNLKDSNKEKCIHRELEIGCLDWEVAEALRKESNPEDFVRAFETERSFSEFGVR